MNILASGVLVALLAIYITYFIRQSRRTTAWNYVFFAAFFLSALISIFFEVFLGDLLQISLLLFLVVAWLLRRYVLSGALRVAAASCVLVPCFLIHEAWILFIAPALPFLLRSRPRLRHFVITAAALLIFLTWSAVWSHVHPRMTYHLLLPHGEQKINTQDIFGTPSFGQLMHLLYGVHFAGLRGKITLFLKIVKVFALVFAGWIAAANIFNRRALVRQCHLYMALMACSIPFWILAADWGRFTTYYFTNCYASLLVRCHSR